MPHLTLEYTKNLTAFDAGKVLLQLNQALMALGHFEDIDIKSRAIPLEVFLIGTSPGNKAFIHVKLSILSGRTAQVKQALSNSLLRVLEDISSPLPQQHIQLCVEVLEIDRETYAKTTIAP